MLKYAWGFLLLGCLFSCSKMTKESYISQYQQFIENVKVENKNYTEKDWQEKDNQFYKYSHELYEKFREQLTVEDKIILSKYRIEYDVYRYNDELKRTMLDIFNAYYSIQTDLRTANRTIMIARKAELKDIIENYIDNEMNVDADFLIDQSRKIKGAISRILNEITIDDGIELSN